MPAKEYDRKVNTDMRAVFPGNDVPFMGIFDVFHDILTGIELFSTGLIYVLRASLTANFP